MTLLAVRLTTIKLVSTITTLPHRGNSAGWILLSEEAAIRKNNDNHRGDRGDTQYTCIAK